MRKTGVLIVGAGKIAEKHAQAWTRLPGIDLAVTDIMEEAADSMAKRHNVRRVPFDSVASGDLGNESSVVDVCVPTPYHFQYVASALQCAKHVFVEKPLCQTSDEGTEILKAAHSAGKHVQVGYLFRFHPVFAQVKSWLSSGLIGEPHLAMVRMGGRGGAATWKHNAGTGGGALNEMAVHKLDLLTWFLGELELKRVLLRETLLSKRSVEEVECEADAEDLVIAELRSGNTTVLLESDLVSSAYMENIEIHGPNGAIVASVQEDCKSFLFLKSSLNGIPEGYHSCEFQRVDLFEAQLRDFVNRLDDQPRFEHLYQAARHVELLEQMRGADCAKASAFGG